MVLIGTSLPGVCEIFDDNETDEGVGDDNENDESGQLLQGVFCLSKRYMTGSNSSPYLKPARNDINAVDKSR